MGRFLLRRTVQMLVTLWLCSVIGFVIIQLPPGNYLTMLKFQLEQERYTSEQIEAALAGLNERYALEKPFYIQYGRWLSKLLRGDLGYSLTMRADVNKLLNERLALSMAISFAAMLLSMALGIPAGIICAVKQYSWTDHTLTLLAFIGAGIPTMLLALLLMFVAVTVFHTSNVGGLFSPQYIAAPWSLAKVIDLLKHLWLPALIVGIPGIGGRTTRALMLDALGEPFIQTARMKGLSEFRVITRHALRVVLNPTITGLGMSLPSLISGETIMSLVIGLPTVGPLMVSALFAEDLYMAGSILVMLTGALIIGNFLADLALGWLDPRIRLVD